MADDIVLWNSLGGMEWLSIVLAAVASFFVGFLWYTPLFGKAWAKEMGFDMSGEMDGMARGMIFGIIGQLITAFVLWHSIFGFVPSLWGEVFGVEAVNSSAAVYALNGGLFIWLGYFMPQQLTRVAWEKASWRLFAINVSHDLVRLMVMAFIMAFMGPI